MIYIVENMMMKNSNVVYGVIYNKKEADRLRDRLKIDFTIDEVNIDNRNGTIVFKNSFNDLIEYARVIDIMRSLLIEYRYEMVKYMNDEELEVFIDRNYDKFFFEIDF